MRPWTKAILSFVPGVALGARALLRARRAYDPRGKVALVTGGSRGLGLLVARDLLKRGARVVLAARDPEELEGARILLSPHGEVHTVSCDVRDPTSVAALAHTVEREVGGVDILVNVAGIIGVGPFASMCPRDFDDAMATNFWGPLRLAYAVLPGMKERGHGRIVNISSIGGIIPVPHLAPYVASKFALRGFSEALATELASSNVIVTTVCPGLMRTGSARNVTVKGDHEKEYAWFSVADALPFVTMNAERAARRIVRACLVGETHLVLTWPAKVAHLVHGIAPSLVVRAASLVARVLPGDADTEARPGWASASAASPSILTRLADRAAVANNEV